MTVAELRSELEALNGDYEVCVSIPCKKITLYKDITMVATPKDVEMVVICSDKLSKVQEDDLNV